MIFLHNFLSHVSILYIQDFFVIFLWQLLFLMWVLFSIFYRTRVRSLVMLVSNWLTHWLTDCRLVNLIDVTLVCEDANSKLVEVVTVADYDAEDHVGNSLL